MSIIVIGTLDTKGVETGFVRDQVVDRGAHPLVLDPGILGRPTIGADVTRQEIAEAAGERLEELIASRDKARCQEAMIAGLVRVVADLHQEGKVEGVIGIGGAQGTAMATAAMQQLPIGIPKVMVSTVACGRTPFGPYVGTKDITMIHSVADVLGLNAITSHILAQAAAAVVAMASVEPADAGEQETVAITQAGITTPGVMAVKELLEQDGFEVLAFHCNGIGGQAMEELVLAGRIRGVIDFSPHEITDLLFDGLMPAHPDRMKAAGQVGIPQVVAPGCTDIRLHGVLEELPDDLRRRPCVKHSPTHTHVRTTPQEMAAVATFIARRLNEADGPRAAIVPLRGFSMLNRPGEVLYDEAANQAYLEALKGTLASSVKLVEVDAHINDHEFAAATVELFLELYEMGQEDRG